MAHLQFILRNKATGKEITVDVNDMVSPTGGYTQAYIDRAGVSYASERATEQHNGSWSYVSGHKS